MANQTEIAQELSRIETAKGVLTGKAADMDLVYTDADGGTKLVSATDPLEMVADAFNDIYVIDQENDIIVVENTVAFPAGYLTSASTAAVPKVDLSKPVIDFNQTTGDLWARIEQPSGYTEAGTEVQKINIGSDYNSTGIIPENIKYGVKIFGIEGTFTDDANVTAGGMLEGYKAYMQGNLVEGTMPNHGAMGLIQFNPLEEDIHTCISNGNGGYVSSLSVKVTNHLLNRLKAI